jgi:hypothetical protein
MNVGEHIFLLLNEHCSYLIHCSYESCRSEMEES